MGLSCSLGISSFVPANSLVKSFSHIINPLLTKLVRSRWLDIGLVLLCGCVCVCVRIFMDQDEVSVHKTLEKIGQYPAILTEQVWSITHNYIFVKCLGLGYFRHRIGSRARILKQVSRRLVESRILPFVTPNR